MHRLMVTYAVFFNRRYDEVGHLFQGRYKSLLVEEGSYLLELSRCLHLNPVRGQVIGSGNPKERRARLRAYAWSSYRGYAGLAKQQEFVSQELVLGELSARSGREGRVRYRRFVEEGLLRELRNPVEAAQWQTALGSEDFLQRVRDKMQPQRPKRREVQALRQGTKGPDPLALIALIAEQHDLPMERLLQGKEYGLQARSIAMWVVWQLCELSLREVGALFGGMDYAAVAQRLRRLERKHAIQKQLQKVLFECQNV